jgi:hypothetical protein
MEQNSLNKFEKTKIFLTIFLSNTSSWSQKITQKPWPEPTVLAFLDLRPGQSRGQDVTLTRPSPRLEAGPCTSLEQAPEAPPYVCPENSRPQIRNNIEHKSAIVDRDGLRDARN